MRKKEKEGETERNRETKRERQRQRQREIEAEKEEGDREKQRQTEAETDRERERKRKRKNEERALDGSDKCVKLVSFAGQESSTSVVLTCGFGFRTRPGHEAKSDSQMDNYGVLVVWDSALPRIKSVLDEIRKEQAPFK